MNSETNDLPKTKIVEHESRLDRWAYEFEFEFCMALSFIAGMCIGLIL